MRAWSILALCVLMMACKPQAMPDRAKPEHLQHLAVGQSWNTIQGQALAPPSLPHLQQDRVLAEFDRAVGFVSGISFASRRHFEEAATGKRFVELDRVASSVKGSPDQARWLVYGAWISAVGRSFDDAFVFYPPHMTDEAKKQFTGLDEGVGIEIDGRSGQPVVKRVSPDSPAGKAGIQEGFKVVGVEESGLPPIDLAEASPSEVKQMLNGPPGSRATVHVAGDAGPERMHLLRSDWIDAGLRVQKHMERGVWVVSVPRFYAATQNASLSSSAELKKIITQIQGDPYVLDLRSNPGGAIDQSAEVASAAGARGRLWEVSSRRASVSFESSDPGNHLPMAVWVDEATQAAAAAVAGSFQERGVPIVGKKTSGSLLMQLMVPLDRDSFLKRSHSETGIVLLTTARLRIGEKVKAVFPDCEVPGVVAKPGNKEYSKATKACMERPRG